MSKINKTFARVAVAFVLSAVAFMALSLSLSSCNVTRRTTVESSYFTRGDTAVQITTKTIETYEAQKK